MSDRFSLAVLLFYMFMLGHPLKGKRELTLPYDGSDPCWGCGKVLETPPRMRLGGEQEPLFVVLNSGARLFPHHLESDPYNFDRILAEVSEAPPELWNLSRSSWTCRGADGSIFEVRSNEALSLAADTQISFGNVEAQVRVRQWAQWRALNM